MSIPQFPTKSALDKNFKANANSKKPKVTLTLVIHPPDLGMDLRALGKKANNPKGSAKANPKPAIPKVSWSAPPSTVIEPASNEPNIGPVHEKDTIAKVSAIKKIPNTPPPAEAASERFPQLLGKVNS